MRQRSLFGLLVALAIFASPAQAIVVENLPVLPQSIVTAQAAIATTNTAVQLASHVLHSGLVVKALATNHNNITVGGSSVTNTSDGTGNGFVLEPGASATFTVFNANVLYINGYAGDGVSEQGN